MSVFRIPELATLVCSFAELQDCARLLRTCKAAFGAGVPFVWHALDSAQPVLLLFSGAKVSRGPKIVTTVDLSERMSRQERFYTYSPHIKHLNVYGKRSEYFRVAGWFSLLGFGRGILPNLLSLTLRNSSNSSTQDQLLWVLFFASRTLVELQILPADPRNGQLPWISWTTTSVIFKVLAERCLKLRTLAIHPDMSARPERYDEFAFCLVHFMEERPYDTYIDRFSNVRELATTTAMIGPPALGKLSKLPHLEKLTVYNCTDGVGEYGNYLDEEAFRSLKKLSLYVSDPDEVIRALHITPMVNKLESLELYFCLDEVHFEDGDDQEDWLAETLLPCLSDASDLKHLVIDIDMLDRQQNNVELSNIDDLTGVLSTLQLHTVAFISFAFRPHTILPTSFVTLLPSVTRLQLPHQLAPPHVLSCLANLPNLEYLLVKLQLELIEPSMNKLNSPGRALHTLECSKGSLIGAKLGHLGDHGRFLLSLWPNIKHISFPSEALSSALLLEECIAAIKGM